MDLKIVQLPLERVETCKRCWKTEESAGHGGFFWRTVLSLTVQNKQWTHEQPSQNKKTAMNHQSWIIQLTTHRIKNQGFLNFWMRLFEYFSYLLSSGLNVNIFYVKHLTQDSTKYKITCILYDLSLFCYCSQILQGVPKLKKKVFWTSNCISCSLLFVFQVNADKLSVPPWWTYNLSPKFIFF